MSMNNCMALAIFFISHLILLIYTAYTKPITS